MSPVPQGELARKILDAVPEAARRAVPVPSKLLGSVAGYDVDFNLAQVVVDGDVSAISATNATGFALAAGERVVVDFYPPHGVLITGTLTVHT